MQKRARIPFTQAAHIDKAIPDHGGTDNTTCDFWKRCCQLIFDVFAAHRIGHRGGFPTALKLRRGPFQIRFANHHGFGSHFGLGAAQLHGNGRCQNQVPLLGTVIEMRWRS